MKWRKKEIVRGVVSLIMYSFPVLGLLFFVISYAVDYFSGGEINVYLLVGLLVFLAFGALIVWLAYKGLMVKVKKYKGAAEGGLLYELKSINPFNSYEEMRDAFHVQRQNRIYEDDVFVITESFFANIEEDYLFIIDGILDVQTLVRKINSTIDYVSLNILYYDGEKYECKFQRPTAFYNMQKKVKEIESIANFVAQKSKNFRKYQSYTF